MSSPKKLDIVATLEGLSTKVQQAANDSSPELDHVLRDAIQATENLLKSTMPENVSEPWLKELSTFSAQPHHAPSRDELGSASSTSVKGSGSHQDNSGSAIHVLTTPTSNSIACETTGETSEPMTCVCGTLFTVPAKSTDTSQIQRVTCIHGCDRLFHSAKCRKTHSQAHARVCPALERKKILKRIGLTPDPDLF